VRQARGPSVRSRADGSLRAWPRTRPAGRARRRRRQRRQAGPGDFRLATPRGGVCRVGAMRDPRCRRRPGGYGQKSSQLMSKCSHSGSRKSLLSAAAPGHRDFFIWLWWYSSCMLQPGRREDSMNCSRFTRSSPAELQFWLRGRGIVCYTVFVPNSLQRLNPSQPLSYRRLRACDPPSERSSTARAATCVWRLHSFRRS
jgi:hypothetical protein